MTEETEIENNSGVGKKFFKKHWNMLAYWILAAIIAAIGAVLVFLWFVEEAQSTSLVPMTLGEWTMGHYVTFILNLVFWELLIVGIPVAIVSIVGWVWWKQIPDAERKEYEFFKRSRTENGGEGISFLFFIVFCIKVYIDGNWDVAIASWTLNYIVDSMITIIVWGAIVFGIPAIIIGLIWLSRQSRNEE